MELRLILNSMEIKNLLQQSLEIWAGQKLNLGQIIVRYGKVFGDICRYERDAIKDKAVHNDEELKKELGNMIFCTIRWCNDLDYNPEECIQLAIDCQKKFQK